MSAGPPFSFPILGTARWIVPVLLWTGLVATACGQGGGSIVLAGRTRVVEGHAGTSTAWVPVTLSAPSAVPVSVAWATADGTATSGQDYAGASGTVVFAPGEVVRSLAVEILGDTVDEPDESVTVVLSAPVGATLGEATGRVLIVEDEPVTPVSLPTNPIYLERGTLDSPPLIYTPNPSTTRVARGMVLSGTATAGLDVTLGASAGTLDLSETFALVPLAFVDDALAESDETFRFQMTERGPGVALVPGPPDQTLTVNSTLTGLAVEGDLLVTSDGSNLTMWRRGSAGWAVEHTISGASEGGVAGVALHQGVVAADFLQTGVKLFTREGGNWSLLKTVGRLSDEPDARRTLALQDDTLVIGDPSTAGLPGGTGRVWVHERHAGGPNAWGLRHAIEPAAPQSEFGRSVSLWGNRLAVGTPDLYSIAVYERSTASHHWSLAMEVVRVFPDFGRSFLMHASLLVVPARTSLLTWVRTEAAVPTWSEKSYRPPVTLAAGTPVIFEGGLLGMMTNGGGLQFFYQPVNGLWSPAAPVVAAPPSPVTPPRFVFDGHTLIRTGASGPSGPSLLAHGAPSFEGLIVDDDTIHFSIDDARTGGGFRATTVHLSRPLPLEVTAQLLPRAGTALPNDDFQPAIGLVRFGPGKTSVSAGFFTFEPLPEEGIESFFLGLANPTTGTVGPEATITIVPTELRIGFTQSTFSFSEGDVDPLPVTITLTLSGPATAGASYRWRLSRFSEPVDRDVVAATGLVSLAPGATTSSFEVLVKGDQIGEENESFSIELEDLVDLNPMAGTSTTTLLLTNDDVGVPSDDTFPLAQGGELVGVNVTANDSRMVRVVIDQGTSYGVVAVDGDGVLTYRPNSPNFIGRDVFRYRDAFQNPNEPPKTALVFLDVADGRRPPLLQPDGVYNVLEDRVVDQTSPSSVTLFRNDGLLNLAGVPFDPILEMRILDVSHGVVSDYESMDGRFKFTPFPDFAGMAGFSYQVRDKDGWSEPAAVSILVRDDLLLSPFQRTGPPGSQLFAAFASSVALPVSGSVEHVVTLRAGQTVSLRVGATDGPLIGRLEVQNVAGSALPGGVRSATALENVPVPADGVYRLVVGDRAVAGNVNVAALVNGGLPGRPTDPAVPYDLDAARPAGSLRAAVSTTTSTTTTPHHYVFTAAAGETVRLYLSSSFAQSFSLRDPLGEPLALSTVSPLDPKAASVEFTAAAAGPVRVVVDGLGNTSYTLQLYRDGSTHEFLVPAPPTLNTAAAGVLEGRGTPDTAPAGSVLSFAAFADYGSGSTDQAAVAAMVKSWHPDFLIAAGDHNYSLDYSVGTPSWTRNVGAFFGSYIKGRVDNRFPEQTSLLQRFFPVPGNHDSGPDSGNGGELSSYFDYFHSNPGGPPRLPAGVHQPRLSYYKISWGPAEFYFLDSDNAVVDLAARATQRQWLKSQLAASTARWKFGVWHHPPYSSSAVHGNHPAMQWGEDFSGLTAIITGHDHIYERLDIGHGVTQFITGIGGNSIYGLASTPVPQSRFRYNAGFGALRGIVGPEGVRFEFRTAGSLGGTVIDSVSFGTPPSIRLPSGADTWALPVRRGQNLHLSTRTPLPPGSLPHGVDPALELVDASGSVVATAASGAGDGLNAVLTYTVPGVPASPDERLPWTVRVLNQTDTAGEYQLHLGSPAFDAYSAWAAVIVPAGLADPAADADQDGSPNLLEYLLQSDPSRPSAPTHQPLAVSAESPGELQINLPASWDQPVTVRLQRSADLASSTWITVATKTPEGPWSSAVGTAPMLNPAGGYRFTPPPGRPVFYRLALSLE